MTIFDEAEHAIMYDSNGKPIVPDNSEELASSARIFQRLNKKYKDVLKAHKKNEISEQDLDLWKASIKTQVEDVLYQIGTLSIDVSVLQEPLKDYYYKTMKPAMAETMFNKDFDAWVEPYDNLKNKCFQLMGKIVGEEL